MIVIWNMGAGGIQKRVRDLLLDIDKNYPNWQVFLIVKFKQPSYFVAEVLRETRVKAEFMSTIHIKTKSWPAIFWIMKQYWQIRPTVLLTFLDHLSIEAVGLRQLIFWRKTRVVLNEGVYTSKYLVINRSWFWRYLIKWFYPHAHKIIVPTKAIKADLMDNFGVEPQTVTVVPNWTLWQRQPRKKIIYDLVFVGRFEKEKNPRGFVDLVAMLNKSKQNIKAAMVGEGSQGLEVKTLIENLKLKREIEILGQLNSPADVLKQASLLVMTTLNEGMPNVVLEAAMCQVPTVTTNFAGADEVVKNGITGYVCNSMKEMVEKCKELLDHPEKRKKMGLAAQLMMEREFGKNQQERFIQELLGEGHD